jgi:hypothetical protein
MRPSTFPTGVSRTLLLLALAIGPTTAIAQEGFSCSSGRPACLGYGDKVVDQNSTCFSSGTCGYQGFVCKSKMDELVNDYDTLTYSHNDLIRRNRNLAETAEEILAKNKTLVSDYNDLLLRFQTLSSASQSQADELRTLNFRYNILLTEQRTQKTKLN